MSKQKYKRREGIEENQFENKLTMDFEYYRIESKIKHNFHTVTRPTTFVLTNSMAYGIRRLNAAFTRALQ